MRSILREQRRSSMAAAAVTMLIGLLLVCWPDRSIRLMCVVLGAAVGITGIIYIGGWVSRRRQGLPAFYVLPGVILVALGLWLMSRPHSVVELIQYICGGILLFHGVVDLHGAWMLLRQKTQRWWLDLVLAAGTIGLGAVILANPFATFETLVLLIGGALIFDGASDLYLIWRLTKAMKDFDEMGSW